MVNPDNSPPPDGEGPILTVMEAMKFLRCSSATIYRLMESGAIPFSLVGSRRRLFRDDLVAYLVSTSNRRSA